MNACRACGDTAHLTRVLDLGNVPAADFFPPADEPVRADEASHRMALDLCGACGLAQLAEDDTVADEPRGVEPQALKDQAVEALSLAKEWLQGSTVREFGSPHGGSWLPLLTEQGFEVVDDSADVVIDCLGIMHDPDQRAAFIRRAAATNKDGVLLIQFHSLLTIVNQGQWNSVRHGHFAYYSLTSLVGLLKAVGMTVATVWEFDLYGGTVLAAAVHGKIEPDASVHRLLAIEAEAAITSPETVKRLQLDVDQQLHTLRAWLESEVSVGRSVYAYAAASRAVALFSLAGVDSRLIRGVADASPTKLDRRMPATDVEIISPEELLARNPDSVLLTVPDLHGEVTARFPQLNGRWVIDPPGQLE